MGLYCEEKKGYVDHSFGMSTQGLCVREIGGANTVHQRAERAVFIVQKVGDEVGKPGAVSYGNTIRLQNWSSHCWVKASRKHASTERNCFQMDLTPQKDLVDERESHFRVMPCSKLRQVGEPVRWGDQISLQVVATEHKWLHVSSTPQLGGDQTEDHHAGTMYECNSSPQASFFTVRLVDDGADPLEEPLCSARLGSPVWLHNRQSEGFLFAQCGLLPGTSLAAWAASQHSQRIFLSNAKVVQVDADREHTRTDGASFRHHRSHPDLARRQSMAAEMLNTDALVGFYMKEAQEAKPDTPIGKIISPASMDLPHFCMWMFEAQAPMRGGLLRPDELYRIKHFTWGVYLTIERRHGSAASVYLSTDPTDDATLFRIRKTDHQHETIVSGVTFVMLQHKKSGLYINIIKGDPMAGLGPCKRYVPLALGCQPVYGDIFTIHNIRPEKVALVASLRHTCRSMSPGLLFHIRDTRKLVVWLSGLIDSLRYFILFCSQVATQNVLTEPGVPIAYNQQLLIEFGLPSLIIHVLEKFVELEGLEKFAHDAALMEAANSSSMESMQKFATLHQAVQYCWRALTALCQDQPELGIALLPQIPLLMKWLPHMPMVADALGAIISNNKVALAHVDSAMIEELLSVAEKSRHSKYIQLLSNLCHIHHIGIAKHQRIIYDRLLPEGGMNKQVLLPIRLQNKTAMVLIPKGFTLETRVRRGRSMHTLKREARQQSETGVQRLSTTNKEWTAEPEEEGAVFPSYKTGGNALMAVWAVLKAKDALNALNQRVQKAEEWIPLTEVVHVEGLGSMATQYLVAVLTLFARLCLQNPAVQKRMAALFPQELFLCVLHDKGPGPPVSNVIKSHLYKFAVHIYTTGGYSMRLDTGQPLRARVWHALQGTGCIRPNCLLRDEFMQLGMRADGDACATDNRDFWTQLKMFSLDYLASDVVQSNGDHSLLEGILEMWVHLLAQLLVTPKEMAHLVPLLMPLLSRLTTDAEDRCASELRPKQTRSLSFAAGPEPPEKRLVSDSAEGGPAEPLLQLRDKKCVDHDTLQTELRVLELLGYVLQLKKELFCFHLLWRFNEFVGNLSDKDLKHPHADSYDHMVDNFLNNDAKKNFLQEFMEEQMLKVATKQKYSLHYSDEGSGMLLLGLSEKGNMQLTNAALGVFVDRHVILHKVCAELQLTDLLFTVENSVVHEVMCISFRLEQLAAFPLSPEEEVECCCVLERLVRLLSPDAATCEAVLQRHSQDCRANMALARDGHSIPDSDGCACRERQSLLRQLGLHKRVAAILCLPFSSQDLHLSDTMVRLVNLCYQLLEVMCCTNEVNQDAIFECNLVTLAVEHLALSQRCNLQVAPFLVTMFAGNAGRCTTVDQDLINVVMQVCVAPHGDVSNDCIQFFRQIICVNGQYLAENQEAVLQCLLSHGQRVLHQLAHIGPHTDCAERQHLIRLMQLLVDCLAQDREVASIEILRQQYLPLERVMKLLCGNFLNLEERGPFLQYIREVFILRDDSVPQRKREVALLWIQLRAWHTIVASISNALAQYTSRVCCSAQRSCHGCEACSELRRYIMESALPCLSAYFTHFWDPMVAQMEAAENPMSDLVEQITVQVVAVAQDITGKEGAARLGPDQLRDLRAVQEYLFAVAHAPALSPAQHQLVRTQLRSGSDALVTAADPMSPSAAMDPSRHRAVRAQFAVFKERLHKGLNSFPGVTESVDDVRPMAAVLFRHYTSRQVRARQRQPNATSRVMLGTGTPLLPVVARLLPEGLVIPLIEAWTYIMNELPVSIGPHFRRTGDILEMVSAAAQQYLPKLADAVILWVVAMLGCTSSNTQRLLLEGVMRPPPAVPKFAARVDEFLELLNAGRAADVTDHQLLSITALLRFLHLLTEGHFLEAQLYMARQPNNTPSVDLVAKVLVVAVSLAATFMAEGDRFGPVLTQTLYTLTEFCQGPCVHNQAILVSQPTNIMHVLNTLLADPAPAACVSLETLRAVRQAALDTLASVIEACDDAPRGTKLVEELDFVGMRRVMEHMASLTPGNDPARTRTHIFPYFLLMHQLKHLCPDYMHLSLGLVLPDQRLCADEELYMPHLATVEICRNGKLERVHFQKLALCAMLGSEAKATLLQRIDFKSQTSKLLEFFDGCHTLMYELRVREKYNKALLASGFPQWIVPKTAHVHLAFENLMLGLVVVLNVLLVLQPDAATGRASLRMRLVTYWLGLLILLTNFTGASLFVGIKLTVLLQQLQGRDDAEGVDLGRVASDVVLPWHLLSWHSFLQRRWARHTASWAITREIRLCLFTALLVFMTCVLAFVHNLTWFALPLVLVMRKSDTLQHVFQAVTLHSRGLFMTGLLAVVMNYFFTLIAVVMFPTQMSEGEARCSGVWQCFAISVTSGVRAGGGIGDLMTPPSWDDDPMMLRRLFDLTYFVVIIFMLMNIAQAIIIDTFAELRASRDAREEELTGRCFICGIEASTFNNYLPGGFEAHHHGAHDMWNYFYFLLHLHSKPSDEFTGPESYVWDHLQRRDIAFIPMGKSMDLSAHTAVDTEEEPKQSPEGPRHDPKADHNESVTIDPPPPPPEPDLHSTAPPGPTHLTLNVPEFDLQSVDTARSEHHEDSAALRAGVVAMQAHMELLDARMEHMELGMKVLEEKIVQGVQQMQHQLLESVREIQESLQQVPVATGITMYQGCGTNCSSNQEDCLAEDGSTIAISDLPARFGCSPEPDSDADLNASTCPDPKSQPIPDSHLDLDLDHDPNPNCRHVSISSQSPSLSQTPSPKPDTQPVVVGVKHSKPPTPTSKQVKPGHRLPKPTAVPGPISSSKTSTRPSTKTSIKPTTAPSARPPLEASPQPPSRSLSSLSGKPLTQVARTDPTKPSNKPRGVRPKVVKPTHEASNCSGSSLATAKKCFRSGSSWF